MNIYIPYTYLIGWTTHNKYYYGVQYGKTANPSNLWCNYFTSSKSVKQFCEQFGEPDVIQVRQCFTDALHAKQWEDKVLTRMNAANNSIMLNMSNNNSFKNIVMTEKMKEKISKSNAGRMKGIKQSPEFIKKRADALRGFKHSEQTRKAYSIAAKNRWATMTPEDRQNFSEACKKRKPNWLGKKHLPETKKKISDALKGKYCGELNGNYGKKWTQEMKDKLSIKKKGKPSWNKGKKLGPTGKPAWNKGLQMSEEYKQKMSEACTGIPKSEETKQKMRQPKIKCCRISDKREMSVNHFNRITH